MIIQQEHAFTTNMISRIKVLTCSLVLLQLYCAVSPMEECFNPTTTVEYVQSCPENLQAWKQAAERKNCSVYQPTCQNQEKLVYHCVTNPWNNAILEVCAFEQSIVGHYCPEFNLEGRIIQENYQVSCKEAFVACPFYYYSTEVYKYPSCFRINEEKRNTTTDGLTTNSSIKSSESLQTTRKFQFKNDSMTTHSETSLEWEITDVLSNESILVTVKSTEDTNNHPQVPGILSVIIPVVVIYVVSLVSITFLHCFYYRKKCGMEWEEYCRCGTCLKSKKHGTFLKIKYSKPNAV